MKQKSRHIPEPAVLNQIKKPITGSKLPDVLFQNQIYPLILIFLFSFLLYGNTIPHGLTIDDYYVTGSKSDAAGGISSIPEIFTSRYHDFGKKNQFEYRPLVKISYAIEYEFFGDNPSISHLINILLYALTGWLIFVLLRRFFHQYHPLLALLTALLFLAHPIHTEVVNSLKNRDEILSFLFGLFALRSSFRFADTRKWQHIAWSILFLSLAFLGKSSAVVFLAIIPIALMFFSDLKVKHLLIVFGSLALVLIAYRYLPRLYLPPSFRGKEFYENPLMFEPDLFRKTATVFVILLQYLKLSFFPHPLLYYYGYNTIPVVGWSSGLAFLSFIIYIFLGVLSLFLARRKHPVGFGILFFLLTISVFSNLLQPLMGIIADRFLHGAILGFCIVLAWGIYKISGVHSEKASIHPHRFKLLIIISLIILIPYSARTIVRNRDWKDNYSLISRDVKHADDSFIIQKAYANELQRQVKSGKMEPTPEVLELIINTYHKAISIYPYHPDPFKQLGQIHLGLAEYDKAIPFFKRAIELTPEKGAYNYYNLGICYSHLNEFEKAIGFFRRGAEILPEDRGFYHLALAYAQSMQPELGIETCNKALEINSYHKMTLLLRGTLYEAKGEFPQALADYETILKMDPGNEKAMERLEYVCNMKGLDSKLQSYVNASKGEQQPRTEEREKPFAEEEINP